MWTLAEHSFLQITGVFRVRCLAPPDRPLRRQHGTHTVDRIRPSFHNPIFSPPLPIVSLHSVNPLDRVSLYQLWCFRISAWLVSAPRMEWLIRLSRGRFLSRLATTCENRGKCKFVFFSHFWIITDDMEDLWIIYMPYQTESKLPFPVCTAPPQPPASCQSIKSISAADNVRRWHKTHSLCSVLTLLIQRGELLRCTRDYTLAHGSFSIFCVRLLT